MGQECVHVLSRVKSQTLSLLILQSPRTQRQAGGAAASSSAAAAGAPAWSTSAPAAGAPAPSSRAAGRSVGRPKSRGRIADLPLIGPPRDLPPGAAASSRSAGRSRARTESDDRDGAQAGSGAPSRQQAELAEAAASSRAAPASSRAAGRSAGRGGKSRGRTDDDWGERIAAGSSARHPEEGKRKQAAEGAASSQAAPTASRGRRSEPLGLPPAERLPPIYLSACPTLLLV